jgi:thiol-disulfide isomerase/thioredoxin
MSLPDLNGAGVSAEALKSGKRKVLFFWASWCHFCQRELENLPAHLEFMKAQNIELVAVNVGETSATVARYKEKSGFPYQIVLDAQGELSDELGILGIPTFVYYSQGKELERTNYFSPGQARQIFRIENKK